MLVKGGMKKGRAEVARDVLEAIFGGALVLVQKDGTGVSTERSLMMKEQLNHGIINVKGPTNMQISVAEGNFLLWTILEIIRNVMVVTRFCIHFSWISTSAVLAGVNDSMLVAIESMKSHRW